MTDPDLIAKGKNVAERYATERRMRQQSHDGAFYTPPPTSTDDATDGEIPDYLADMRDGVWLDSQQFPPLQWTVSPELLDEAVAAGGTALGAILTLALRPGHYRIRCGTGRLGPAGTAMHDVFVLA